MDGYGGSLSLLIQTVERISAADHATSPSASASQAPRSCRTTIARARQPAADTTISPL